MEIKICPACSGGCPATSPVCPGCGVIVVSAPAMPGESLKGLRIAGKYELAEHLAAGSMGHVYRAVHKDLGNSVAVKLLVDGYENQEWVARFQREAKAISRLSHPHILSVIDFGEDPSGIFCLITEFVRGRSLAMVLAEDGPFPLRRAARILCQILAALEESHEAGVVHRDLKPQNIMVTDLWGGEDFVKVVDFGIADLVDERFRKSPTVGEVCGTPAYISPEQIRGEEATGASDIYAAGVVLFEMLTGRLPFLGTSVASMMEGHLQEPVPLLQDVRPGIQDPERVQALIQRAMAKKALDRFPSAAAFRRSLAWLIPAEGTRGRMCHSCCRLVGSADVICPGCSAPIEAFPNRAITSGLETMEMFPGAITSGLEISPGTSALCPQALSSCWRCPYEGRLPGCLPRPFPSIERPAVTEGIHGLLDGARPVLHVIGPPGMGKTTAAGRAYREALEAGFEVVWAEPHPALVPVPWVPVRWAVAQVLGLPARPSTQDLARLADSRSWRRGSPAGLLELFGRSGPLSDAGPPLRRLEAALAALEILRAPADHPRLIVFDDVDKFDEPSRKLVLRLVDECAGTGVRLLLAAECSLIDPGPDTMVVPLEPLPSKAILDCMEPGIEQASEKARQMAAKIVDGGGGNPLWIRQSFALAYESGDVGPETLAGVLATRVHRLPGPLREALAALALLGMEASPEELAIVGRGDPIKESDVEFLERHLFLEGEGRSAPRGRGKAATGWPAGLPGASLRLAHPIMVGVIRKLIPADARKELGARALRLLEGAGAPEEVLARLALEAGEFSRALDLLRRAGDHAVDALDSRGAASLYREAIEVFRCSFPGGEEGHRHLELSASLGEALLADGDLATCEEVLRNAAKSRNLSGALAVKIRRTQAMAEWRRGDLRGAADTIRLALREAGGDCRQLMEMLLNLGKLLERLEGAEEASAEIRTTIEPSFSDGSKKEDKGASCLWLLEVLLAWWAAQNQGPGGAGALRLIEEALLEAERQQSTVGQGVCYHLLAELLEAAGRAGDSQRHRQACVRILAPLGGHPGLARGLVQSLTGDLEATERIRSLAVNLDGDLEWYRSGSKPSGSRDGSPGNGTSVVLGHDVAIVPTDPLRR